LDDQALAVERLVEEAGIDGFFLDTMRTVPDSFVRLARERFPQLMFASEGTPQEPRQIEQLTGSWDQIGAPTRVEANLFRFVFPEHGLNMISRWSVGADKDTLISRAIFNGTGLVIWQDIFGTWLPYDDAQKERIKQWKSVLKEHHACIFGQASYPLARVQQHGVLANVFSDDLTRRQIVTVYNSNPCRVHGTILAVPEMVAPRCRVLIGPENAFTISGDDPASLKGQVEPGEVIVVMLEKGSR
jgi:hypothetical protein